MTKAGKNNIELSIIIVNWNTKELLRNCIESVYSTVPSSTPFNVIIVDNASSDGSPEMVQEKFPDAVVILNSQNVGFARANNVALKKVFNYLEKPDYILFLNSDVVLTPGAVNSALRALEANNKIGAASPALVYPDGTYQTGGAGFRISAYSAFIYNLFLFKILPRKIAKGMFIDQKRYRHLDRPVFVDWVAGACLFVRTTVVEQVGGWNESYFMYAEDVEYCERIVLGGLKIAYLPQVKVIHHHGASSKQNGRPNTRWLVALLQYSKSRCGLWGYFVIRFTTAVGSCLRMCLWFLLFALTGNGKYWNKSRDAAYYFRAALTREGN